MTDKLTTFEIVDFSNILNNLKSSIEDWSKKK